MNVPKLIDRSAWVLPVSWILHAIIYIILFIYFLFISNYLYLLLVIITVFSRRNGFPLVAKHNGRGRIPLSTLVAGKEFAPSKAGLSMAMARMSRMKRSRQGHF